MIPDLMLGTWNWGKPKVEFSEVFDACWEHNIRAFDTAEIYGLGRSEKLLGAQLAKAPELAFVSTKFMPTFWRIDTGAAKRALVGSLKRLGLTSIDLYQIHFPKGFRSIETWMNALADLKELGLISQIGVSNCDAAQTSRARATLAERGIWLASNQIKYSLLDQQNQQLVERCKAQNVQILGYQPLERGLLVQNRPELHELHGLMNDFSDGMPIAAVALAWVKAMGVIPIFGASRPDQVEVCVKSKKINLTPDQIELLKIAALKVKIKR